jgi:drug/metabolite transporter (DMT)-like permease
MLVYLAPVAASVVAHFFLNEKLTATALSLIGLALFGFAMMMEFRIDLSSGSDEFVGLCYGLLALASYAGFILVNRMIRPDVHVYTSTFWQLLCGGLAVTPLAIHSIHEVGPDHTLWLIGVGLFPGFLGIFFAVAALSRLPAATFGTIAYMEAVAVVIFGWTLFQESLSPLQIGGCLLIIASGIARTVMPAGKPDPNRSLSPSKG